MTETTEAELIIELDAALFGPPPFGGFGIGGRTMPYDISRPNIHDSKKDFQREFAAVKKTIKHLQGIIGQYYGEKYADDSKHEEMLDRLIDSVNREARRNYADQSVESASDLILKNLSDDGLFINSLMVMRDTLFAFIKRYEELKAQETEFWSLSHRAPNYYARTIALRFAKHYKMRTQQKPTFGTTREGNDPSTNYGRALEEVFNVLNIEADVRKAAEWALAQIDAEEAKSAENDSIGELLGLGPAKAKPPTSDNIKLIAQLLSKVRK